MVKSYINFAPYNFYRTWYWPTQGKNGLGGPGSKFTETKTGNFSNKVFWNWVLSTFIFIEYIVGI